MKIKNNMDLRGTGEFKLAKSNKKKCDRKKELVIGRNIEMEHASLFPKKIQKKMTGKIAEQHIDEFSCYYSKGLVKMEARLKKMKYNIKLKNIERRNKDVK